MFSKKKWLPNLSSLKHYAATNIITNLLVVLNAGFWMGAWTSFILQMTVEVNQYRNSKLPLKEYMKKHGADAIWDTVFALAGIFTTLINALKWL